MALLFAVVFIATVAAALIIAAVGNEQARTAMNGLLQVLLPAEMALLGAAAAWYFTSG